ncbi:MAG: SDR family oxidoreductase [Kurthia sp.]|nr:SDR family oxidoreductase [Candidatus Kurthia equi]
MLNFVTLHYNGEKGWYKLNLMYTGFPGFITSQLIREQLKKQQQDEIYVLVLSTEIEKAQAEKEAIIQEYPTVSIRIIEGDITLPSLGLEEDMVKKLQQKIHVFWHLAAIYNLAVPKEIAWKVNVHGTNHVNEFVKEINQLERYMYFSTAYVAGTRTGNLLETELIRPESFKNYYEETKFEAELLVEDLKQELPITIIRPGIVRGNSTTGATIKFDGPYFLFNMIDRLKKLPFIPYIGRTSATLNTVPVDYIFEAVTYLSTLPEAVGKTVHLTDPNPHPIQEILRAVTLQITGKTPKGHLPLGVTRVFMKNKTLQRKLGVEYESLDYFTWDASFDTSVISELLKDSSIQCADFIDTLPAMAGYYEEHKNRKEYHIQIN